jgi:hypothetical protein
MVAAVFMVVAGSLTGSAISTVMLVIISSPTLFTARGDAAIAVGRAWTLSAIGVW